MHIYYYMYILVPESRKLPILEITLEKVLQGLDMNMEQFIDLCILMGCDYCGYAAYCMRPSSVCGLLYAALSALTCAF